MSEEHTNNERRRILTALAASGGVVTSAKVFGATENVGNSNIDHIEKHFQLNHYHKFHVGPVEFDIVADMENKMLKIKAYPFFSSHLCFMELELSEEKGFDIKRVFHVPVLGWGGEGEFEADLAHHKLMCNVVMDTPIGRFRLNPTWQWAQDHTS